MASLLSWVGNGVKRVENTFNNDVVQPVKRDVVAPVQKAVAQVNPLDNGRTWQNPQGNAPQQQAQHLPIPSAFQQATHNGLTNVTGGVVKTIPQFAVNYANTFANLGTRAAGGQNRTVQQNFNTDPLSRGTVRLSGATGKNTQLANDALQIGLSSFAPGSSKVIEGGLAKVAPEIVPKVIPKVISAASVGAPVGAVSNVGSYLSSGQPVTKQGVINSAKQGAEFGAAGGAVLPLAPYAARGVARAGEAALPVIKAGAQKTGRALAKADERTFAPRVALNDQYTLQALSDHISGAKPLQGKELSDTIASAREVAKRNGVELATGTPAERLDKTNSLLDAVRFRNKTARQSGHAEVGGPLLPIPKLPKRLSTVEAPSKLRTTLAKSPTNKMDTASYAKTFGISSEQAKNDLATVKQTDTNIRPIPKQQVPRTPAQNTQLNPMKVTIPEVAPGNFEQARINPQLASHPVSFATGEAIKTQKGLGLDNSTFGKMVEGTIKPRNAAEQKAVDSYVAMTNRAHATSQALGGNTNYIGDPNGVKNYFNHKWDLSTPELQAKFNEIAKKNGTADPFNFAGINNQPRVFKTVAAGEKAGFKLAHTDPIKAINEYGSGSAYALKQQALSKGMLEADMSNMDKTNTFDLGNGKSLPVSQQAMHEFKGYQKQLPTNSKVVGGYRAVNRGLKQTLLSASEFHPINISALKAGPALALRGHPGMAAKGVFDTFASQVGHKYSDKLQAAALKDGTVEASARLGTPIKFGSDYATSGQLNIGKAGVGEHTIFEKSMPAMHIQMVKGVLADLKKRNIPIDSPQAHAVGTRINEIMGFVNTEVRNLDKGHQRQLSDIALAPQFTRAKWATLKSAVKDRGLAGSYARRAVVGNSAAALTASLALGYIAKQKSDNTNDLILRSIFHPSVPTSGKDKKGNTVELGLPATYSSEALNLMGFSLTRGQDGHLHVGAKAGNLPGNVANYGRSRLAILPSSALKVATNTNYAGKPLYDPNAQLGVKAQQAGTILGSGLLPIGLQGIAQSDAVKSHLPQGIQQVLDANSPGSNPIVKSIGSSFGLTPKTDNTVGKGLQTTQYFNALNGAKNGLNRQEKDALDIYTGGKKNPVTGQYEILPNANDTSTKAKLLLQNPKVIDNLITMNKTLSSQGQSVDPLWAQSKGNITKYLQYQTMPPGGADRTHWSTLNNSWYQPLTSQRDTFFNSLPAADPNKPSSPVGYPTASPGVTALQKTYFSIKDPAQAAQFAASNPSLQTQFDKQAEYNNQMRQAQGYSPLDTFQKASPQVQNIIDTYNAIPKGGGKKGGNLYRSQWIQAHPNEYAAMTQYFTQSSLYSLQKDAGQAQFQDTGFSQKGLKDIYSLGQYDIGKQTDANGNTFYSLGGTQSKYGSSNSTPKQPKIKKYTAAKAYKLPKSPSIKVTSAKTPKFKQSKPKVYAVNKPTSNLARLLKVA